MKTIFLLSTALVLSLGMACASTEVKPVQTASQSEPTPQPTASFPKDGNYNGRGVVTKINNEQGSVELDHDEIPEMPMHAMRMEFNLKDKGQLKALKVGDKVTFVLEYKRPSETIVDIKKVP